MALNTQQYSINRYKSIKNHSKKIKDYEYEDHDGYNCGCCNDYDDDDDYYYEIDDDSYEKFFEERQVYFFKKLPKYNIFTSVFIDEIINNNALVKFSYLTVDIPISLNDIDFSKKNKITDYLANVFEDNNKFDLSITLKLTFNNSEFLNILSFSFTVGLDDKNLMELSEKIKARGSKNTHRLKYRNHSTLESIMNHIESSEYPEYCQTNEDCLIYSVYSQNVLIEKGEFDIYEIITDLDYFNFFKMAIL